MNQEKKIYPGLILDKLIAASAAYKVACPVCGALDNRREERAGLCCHCYCRELNARIRARDGRPGMTLNEAKAEIARIDWTKAEKRPSREHGIARIHRLAREAAIKRKASEAPASTSEEKLAGQSASDDARKAERLRKEKRSVKQKAYAESHKEELKAKRRAYCEAHRDSTRATPRRYKEKLRGTQNG
jgi:hypothetical protein